MLRNIIVRLVIFICRGHCSCWRLYFFRAFSSTSPRNATAS